MVGLGQQGVLVQGQGAFFGQQMSSVIAASQIQLQMLFWRLLKKC
jgi:hypothetical protein